MADPLNANPTILNASDLPTRRRRRPSSQTSSKHAFGLFASSVPSSTYLSDPFSTSLPSLASSDSESDNDADDNDVEPIDEQEIYGETSPRLPPASNPLIPLSRHAPTLHLSLPTPKTTNSQTNIPPRARNHKDLISTISDPEHPLSLGSLAVVSLPDIHIAPLSTHTDRPSPLRTVTVLVTPTITHCSLATVIGLGVRVRLEQALPPRFRVDVRIKDGTHTTADQVNKQLADKERVAAALENGTLMGVLRKMLETCR